MNVLVIEDKPTSRELVVYLLSRAGHYVVEAHDGPTGLRAARATAFDMILCDLSMPGMHGFEVAKALRADPKTAKALLICVTMHDGPGIESEVLRAGFDVYYVKPIDAPQFVQGLEALFQAHK